MPTGLPRRRSERTNRASHEIGFAQTTTRAPPAPAADRSRRRPSGTDDADRYGRERVAERQEHRAAAQAELGNLPLDPDPAQPHDPVADQPEHGPHPDQRVAEVSRPMPVGRAGVVRPGDGSADDGVRVFGFPPAWRYAARNGYHIGGSRVPAHSRAGRGPGPRPARAGGRGARRSTARRSWAHRPPRRLGGRHASGAELQRSDCRAAAAGAATREPVAWVAAAAAPGRQPASDIRSGA